MRNQPRVDKQAHVNNTALYPVEIQNGFLTAKSNRHAPTTDVDHTPRTFRRYVNTGQADVQLNNGLFRRIGQGRRMIFDLIGVDYLYVAGAIQPGQKRDDFGGHKKMRGIDPQSYQKLWQAGPGSQPVNPGGPGFIASDRFYNPGTS